MAESERVSPKVLCVTEVLTTSGNSICLSSSVKWKRYAKNMAFAMILS